MSMRNRIDHGCDARKEPRLRAAATLALAAAIVLMLAFPGSPLVHSVAYASVNKAPATAVAEDETHGQSARSDTQLSYSSSTNGSGSANANADDEPTGEAEAGDSTTAAPEGIRGFEAAVLAGIVVVAVFFVIWIVRLNMNMRKMSDSMHSR